MTSDLAAALQDFAAAADQYNAARTANGEKFKAGLALLGTGSDAQVLALQVSYLVDENIANTAYNTAMFEVLTATLREVADLKTAAPNKKSKKPKKGKKKT